MTRVTLAVVAVAALAAIAVSNTWAGASYSATVEITSITKPAGSPLQFTGSVSSPKPKCRRNRKVVVFQNVAGPSIRVGADSSDRGGNWSLSVDLNPANGDVFFAKAPRKEIGDGKVCKPARSRNRTFTF